MTHADFDRWAAEAKKITDPKALSVPLDVMIGETVEVASFAKKYWQAGEGHGGLASAGPRITETIADDILSLRRATQEAQTRYLLSVDPQKSYADTIERGVFVLGELTATLEWLLDDQVDEPADQDLASLKADHKDDGASADQLAQALHDYGTLAKELKDRMQGLGGFDVALIDEALALADKLGEVAPAGASLNQNAQAAMLLRDQIASLLQDKTRLLRAAARFVFRDQPKILRQVTSSYQRRRRAASRRRRLLAREG